MHSLQPQQNAQLRPRGHDENTLEEAYRGRYARQRLLNFWPESSCGYHAIKRFVCIIQVSTQWSSSVKTKFTLRLPAIKSESPQTTGRCHIPGGPQSSLYWGSRGKSTQGWA